MHLICHGDRAARLCAYLSDLPTPSSMMRVLCLGDPKDTVRFDSLNNLCTAFKNGALPRLVTFHIEIHTDTGEQGIFTLIDAMLKNPLKDLKVLDFEGSYMGQQSARRLAEILTSKKFKMIQELNLSRNGTGEYGTKFLMKGLVADGGACPKVSRNVLAANARGVL